jgi:tetratricopeptide (TPR) repeat protein
MTEAGSDGASEPPIVPVGIPAGQGVQIGDHNIQHNKFVQMSVEKQYVGTQVIHLLPTPSIGQVVAGYVPQEPPAFQPREDLLSMLLAAGPRVPLVRVLTGMRGAGKSQLAAAYARTCIEEGWRLVAWINAGDMAKVLDGLAGVAERLHIGAVDASLGALGELVRDRLTADGERCLVVFDNAADLAGLRRFLPAAGGSQIVITSASAEAAKLGVSVPVGVFALDEALEFLSARTHRDDPGGARELAEELGRLPLALAQAAAVIAAQRLTYQVYLGRLRSLSVRDYLTSADGEPYPDGVAEVILLSMNAVAAADRTGLCSDLADVIALLSTTGVSRELLRAAGPSGVFSEPGRVTPGGIDEAIGRLASASLLVFSGDDDSTVSAHRLVMRVIRERLSSDGNLPLVAARACKLLDSAAGSLDAPWQQRPAVRDLVLQVAALNEHVLPHLREHDTELVRSLLALRLWALRSLRDLGESDIQAIEFGEPLVSDCEHALGNTDPSTLAARSSLASAYRAAGRLSDAIALHERTLADRERELGEDHQDTLASRHDLAVAYKAASRLEEAIGLHERTLADRERVLGKMHRDTLASRSSLASAYGAAGRLNDAIALHEQTLADRERVLGAEHRDTLFSRNNLAYAYDNAERWGEAIPIYERNLAAYERMFDATHPYALMTRYNLAYDHHSEGRLDKAIALYEQMMSDFERVMGESHRHTQSFYANLAAAYQEAGQARRAIPLYERALAGLELLLGSDHPDTARIRERLAAARREATGSAEHER